MGMDWLVQGRLTEWYLTLAVYNSFGACNCGKNGGAEDVNDFFIFI